MEQFGGTGYCCWRQEEGAEGGRRKIREIRKKTEERRKRRRGGGMKHKDPGLPGTGRSHFQLVADGKVFPCFQ